MGQVSSSPSFPHPLRIKSSLLELNASIRLKQEKEGKNYASSVMNEKISNYM